MHRRVLVLGLVCSLLTFGSLTRTAHAQGATPVASAFPGYPELKVTITDTFELSTETVPAGNVVLTVTNSTDSDAGAAVLGPPPGQTLDEFMATAATPAAEENGFPPFLYSAVIPGGPGDVPPGGTLQALVTVLAGDWIVIGDGDQSPVRFSAADGPDSRTDAPVADRTVELSEFSFTGLDQGLSVGSEIWEVKNTGTQPHMLLMGGLPSGTTADQFMAFIQSDATGTPQAGGLTDADITPVAQGVLLVSSGQTLWLPVDLAPGTYGAVCFVTDPDTGVEHAVEGMVSVFTVG